MAYGACEKLMKECARQAEYTVPQMREKKGTEVPKTEKGEELGIGNGWWYDGRFRLLLSYFMVLLC